MKIDLTNIAVFQELLVSEGDLMKEPDYIRKFHFSTRDRFQNPTWRKLVVDWCYAVVDRIGIDREAVYVALDIFDRFLAAKQPQKRATDKKTYEAAIMSSLLLATRLQKLSSSSSESTYLNPNDLADMTATSISSHDLCNTCQEIDRVVRWKKRNHQENPTAAHFAHALVQLFPKSIKESSKTNLLVNAIRQIELSVQDERCMRVSASLLAWMAVENALQQQSGQFSKDDRTEFRELVAEISGHYHSISLRKRLRSLHQDSYPNAYNNNNNELIRRVVSCNCIYSNDTRQQEAKDIEISGLRRSNKVKSLFALSA